jgi:LuxR family maltose regulon positive regulatory protein
MSVSAPLLQTKLYIPPAQPGLISRARLTSGLTAALAYPLTLISAPAGFGKTMLLADWALTARRPAPAGVPGPRFGWLSLDIEEVDAVMPRILALQPEAVIVTD